MIKKIGIGILALFLFLAIIYWPLINYGIAQLKGQLKVVLGAVEIKEILADPMVADSTRRKLLLIQEIREFGFEELGLKRSENYTTFYDQKGQAILWVLTACPEFSLEPRTWSFPIIGEFPYKGFFDEQKGRDELEDLSELGFDVDFSPVAGWSTLGFFKDPVLSQMLRRDEGRLANLILHELTHGTIFIKDSVEFNENLASFIGDQGAELFLRKTFGDGSQELISYQNRRGRIQAFSMYLVQMAPILDSTYRSFDSLLTVEKMREIKAHRIQRIKAGWISRDTLLSGETGYDEWDWNNTLFADYLTYNSQQDILEKQLEEQFDNSLKQMIEFYKNK